MPRRDATMKYMRTSPRKMRRVVDMIRGQHVDEATADLAVLPLGRSQDVEKLLNSAVANAEAQPRCDRENLVIDAGVGRRGPDAQALPPARLRSRHAGPQAHVARDGRGRDDGRRGCSGEQDPPVRVQARGHLPLEVAIGTQGVTTPSSCTRTSGSASTSGAGCPVPASRQIDIERKGDQIWVFIRTARPGIVIGRKGAEVDRMRKDIERYTKKRVDVKVEDMNQASSEVRPGDRCHVAGARCRRAAGRSRGVQESDAPGGPDRDALGRPRRPCRLRGPAGWVPRWAAVSGTARDGCRSTRCAPRSTTARRKPRRPPAASA